MKYLARMAIERAIRRLKLSLQPRAKTVTPEQNEIATIYLLHSVKNDIDIATQTIGGNTSTQRTEYHQKTEEIADKLLDDYFINGDIESIRALASGLITQLSDTQAKEHFEVFEQHYNDCVKRE